MIKLVGTDGSRYFAWDLNPGSYLIGRLQDADLPVPHRTVSRRHARLEVSEEPTVCHITDLESHNGTYINERKITERTEIKLGDHIRFGQTEFKISSPDDKTEADSTPRTSPARFSEGAVEKSVVLSIDEALRPLPNRVTDQPDVVPTIFEMAKMLVLPEPQETLLERSLQLIGRAVPAERIAVLLADSDSGDLYPAVVHRASGAEDEEFTLSQTIVNEILSKKQSVLIGDPHEDPRFARRESIIMSKLKSAMAVPLFDEGKVLGILYADTSNPAHRYHDDYLRLFATFGNLLASRLLNYSLWEERQARQVIETELSRASRIQMDLLPKSIPKVGGYQFHAYQEQSRSVGGDLYDVVTLPDGRVMFLVADVSGKGLGAALLMSNILASFRILYSDPKLDLLRAVDHVSKQLYAYTSPENFATLFIGTLHPETHELKFVNAGHNPPLYVDSGGTLHHIESSGTMIGAFDFSIWKEETRRMEPGELLFIFTDGVVEAKKDEDSDYGEERLDKLVVKSKELSAAELTKVVTDDIGEFVGDAPQSDDITTLVIKRDT